MSVEGSESRRFERSISSVLLRPTLPQHSPRVYSWGDGISYDFVVIQISADRERHRNATAVILEIKKRF